MRIQHNIAALNASNRLKANDNAISKNIAKLSSGYRINSAADDAAGLAVSEKMRAQINGLNQAQSNAENGISLVQTAEGGLNETEAILQRMNTLAVESANGTYQDGTDRSNLNLEISALQKEIDRIADSTNFNQINLLDGSLSAATYSATADADALTANKVGATTTVTGGNLATTDTITITIAKETGEVSATGGATGLTWTVSGGEDGNATKAGQTFTLTASAGDTTTLEDAEKWKGVTVTFSIDEGYAVPEATGSDITGDITVGTKTNESKGISLQIGSENEDYQQVSLNVSDMHAANLDVDSSKVSIATQEDALEAIDYIKTAINKVSAERANLGALQNRLEHTTNNLSTMSENLTSAESSIRDVDMSDEYVQYSKNQILSQAATAMLTQANAQPQNVLSLLKG